MKKCALPDNEKWNSKKVFGLTCIGRLLLGFFFSLSDRRNITILLFYMSSPFGSRIVCCLHLKIEISPCARGINGVAFFISIDEQLQ